MNQTVHNILTNQNLLATAGFGNSPAKSGLKRRKFFLSFLAAFVSFVGMAQTYTTKADGNWNSSSTWVGGSIPTATIGVGMIVNIGHDVTFDLSSDLSISGTLNIVGDTVRFNSSYDKKIMIASTGVLNIKNGGFLQNVSSNKGEMEISGGRIILENAKMSISKNVKALAGTKRTYKNSIVLVGEKYEMEGTSSKRTIDSIQSSTLEVGINSSDFEIKAYCTIRVANAKVTVGKGKLVNKANSDITVLTGATNNYGFDLLRIDQDLENDGSWDARIDAFCIGKDVKGSNFAAVDFTRPEDCNTTVNAAPAPELVFINPVLIKGTANKEGAEYRFSNISTGVDAVVKLKKFSRSDIKMNTVDNNALGWTKAFQPEFGLPGVVAPFQNWYIDFEMTFYEAGKNKKVKMDKVDFTALDVDGDGWSISEYAVFSNPASVAYSTVSNLSSSTAGSLGSLLPCPVCLVSSTLIQCNACQGAGHDAADVDCSLCAGSGALHSGCSHAFQGMVGNILQGPVQNYMNIDTNGTAVMATYQFQNTDKISFRYGAKSSSLSSNGSGIRLNSLWSKSFNLTPWTILPVNFASFAVLYEKGDAILKWQSPQGEELSHFTVQRSTDGKIYTDIATVFAGSTAHYSYKDKGISSATGVVYYRVLSEDRTKESQYSVVKLIRLPKNERQTLTLTTYPNPVASEVRITLPDAWQNKPVTLQLYTANGTTAKSIQLGSASQTESMMLSGLAKGMYVVKATCGQETAQQRIVKN